LVFGSGLPAAGFDFPAFHNDVSTKQKMLFRVFPGIWFRHLTRPAATLSPFEAERGESIGVNQRGSAVEVG
jgi:hypothetical protein